ncbi:MAG: hypothetical protein ACXW05_21055, partial [Gemmatirosa sp.]
TVWIWSMLLVGYFLGSRFPGIDKHLELVILVVIFLSIPPGIVSWLRARRESSPRGGASQSHRRCRASPSARDPAARARRPGP